MYIYIVTKPSKMKNQKKTTYEAESLSPIAATLILTAIAIIGMLADNLM
jgi:hypothetical protein